MQIARVLRARVEGGLYGSVVAGVGRPPKREKDDNVHPSLASAELNPKIAAVVLALRQALPSARFEREHLAIFGDGVFRIFGQTDRFDFQSRGLVRRGLDPRRERSTLFLGYLLPGRTITRASPKLHQIGFSLSFRPGTASTTCHLLWPH